MNASRNQASPEAEQDRALQAQARALDTRTPASELYWEREAARWHDGQQAPGETPDHAQGRG